jgi:hypothetical protein
MLLNHLNHFNNQNKVVFHGINPNSATILYKDGTLAEVSSFPPDDPRGPSGPVQVD